MAEKDTSDAGEGSPSRSEAQNFAVMFKSVMNEMKELKQTVASLQNSENQTYTGTVIFGVESLKFLKGQENLLLKSPALKTFDFCHGEHFL